MITPEQRDEMHKLKTPTTKAKYVGVEIEFSCPFPEPVVLEKIFEAELEKYVTIGYDGAPPEGHIGYEWKILCRQNEVNKIVHRTCQLIESLGGVSNDSCGLHVHLDMRNRSDMAFANLVYAQKMLFAIAHPRRSTSHWCKTVLETNPRKLYPNKSNAINPLYVSSTAKHTVEVRLREGLVNGDDITAWVRLLAAIVDSKNITTPIDSFASLIKQVRVNTFLREYITNKLKENNKEAMLYANVA